MHSRQWWKSGGGWFSEDLFHLSNSDILKWTDEKGNSPVLADLGVAYIC